MKTVYTSGQLVKLTETLEQHGVVPETFQNGFSTGLTADYFEAVGKVDLIKVSREEFRRVLGLGPIVSEPLKIDYRQTLDQMIAVGAYDWKNENITAERFPVNGEGVVEYEYQLVHLNCNASSKKVLLAIGKLDGANPWEPAKTEHLLAFGAKNPEEQRKYPIVALGSVGEVDGDRYVSCLSGDDSGRNVNLGWFGSDWFSSCRFLAVRKITRT